jgi:hypothetical protein
MSELPRTSRRLNNLCEYIVTSIKDV